VLRMNGEIDLRVAESELRRALALDPQHRRAHEYLALLDCWTSRPAEALLEAQAAAAIDPLSVTARREIARSLFLLHRYDDALAELDRVRSMGTPLRAGAEMIAEIHAKKGMFPEAIAELRGRRGGLQLAMLGHTLGQAGDRAGADTVRQELERRFDAGIGGAYYVAAVYAGLHDFDQAFSWLEKSFTDRSTHFTLMDPTFDDLRADPRFAHIRARLGLQNP
jgi:tetratricopeptide (TPR) repeat protein